MLRLLIISQYAILYTNSGAAIDYKTDGTVATASATTETPLGIPVATAATGYF